MIEEGLEKIQYSDFGLVFFLQLPVYAQEGQHAKHISPAHDSTYVMKGITVTSTRALNGVGQMKDFAGEVIYAGMKDAVLEIDSLVANKAINNTRQIIGRIPGVDITENEMGGFTANGIGFRGFNPYQSIEADTCQNGYNISADIYGYNESYYLPPWRP